MLVVLSHLWIVEQKYFYSKLTSVFQFGVLGVDLFFVISGVVISSVTEDKFNSPHSARTFLRRRFNRIFPIYWIYSTLFLAVYLFRPLWFNNSTGHHVSIVKSFLLIPVREGMLVRQGWTLSYELYFYFVFFLLLAFASERSAPLLLVAWGAAIGIVHLLITISGWPVFNVIANPLVFEFLAGCLVFHIYRKAVLHPSVGIVLVAVAVCWLGIIAIWIYRAHGGNELWIEGSIWRRPAFYGSFSALFLLGIMELERTKIVRFTRLFEAVGDWSYSIYLSHVAIVEIVGRMFLRFAPHAPSTIVFVDLTSLVLVLVAGYLCYAKVEFPLLGILSRGAGKSSINLQTTTSVSANS